MARVSGVDLPDNAKVDWALTRIKGIGWSRVKLLLEKKNLADKRVKDLSADEIATITSAMEAYATEGDLLRQIRENVRRLRDISSYRGVRHARGLPVRGQRTKSNARTRRGKRKTVGSFKKDELTKMQQPTQGSE